MKHPRFKVEVVRVDAVRSGITHQLLPVVNVLGFVISLFSISMAVPLVNAVLGEDAALGAWDDALLMTALTGLLLWLGTQAYKRELQPRDGFLLVGLVWTVLPVFAALPFLFWSQQGGAPMSFTQAYFEAASGLTTTGATVMRGVDLLPHSISLWRCQLSWMGGMGFLVLAIAILPLLGVGGGQIYKTSAGGPMKETRLTPRVTETARGLFVVYLVITVLCALAYRMAGMAWFDAFCNAGSTIGLGGFSTHDNSFMYYAAHPWVDFFGAVFMLVASINFAIHFLVLRKRSLGVYVSCPETRWVLFTMLGSAFFVAWWLHERGVYPNWNDALRYGVFNTISLASSGGFFNANLAAWPVFAPVLLIFLSVFASSSGSTGGGIKMIRAVVLIKQTRREFGRILHPRLVNPVRVAGVPIGNNVVFAVLAFMLMYGLTVIIGTFLLLITGLDERSAFTAVMSCINNLGTGLGSVSVGSTYAHLDNFQLRVCSALMLLGRLELFTLLMPFTAEFWRR
jgi:trk system potassium uptake protein TrkH